MDTLPGRGEPLGPPQLHGVSRQSLCHRISPVGEVCWQVGDLAFRDRCRSHRDGAVRLARLCPGCLAVCAVLLGDGGTAAQDLAAGVVRRSAYNVEGDKLGAAHVGKDRDVLRPASGRKYGQVGKEVVGVGTCSAPEEDSFAERVMSCPDDDGNLAPTGIDQCFGAADTYSVRCDNAPGAVEYELPGRRQARDCQDYDGRRGDRWHDPD